MMCAALLRRRCGAEPVVAIAARRGALALALLVVACGCSETLDAGHDRPNGLLPVDQRNPLVLINDGAYDNWSGEYAVLLARAGGSPLAGIVVNASPAWPNLQKNVAGFAGLVAAARTSGIGGLPDPLGSSGSPLIRPASGKIEDTLPNRSRGATFINDISRRLALPYRPVVVATGGALTDVADAYLLDHTVTQRVVVVSSLGNVSSSGAGMGAPNGDADPWADTIVTQRFRYIQVSAFYDQLGDVPTTSVSALPANDLGKWIARKQPNLWHWQPASDQVAVLAAGLPNFATAVERVSPAAPDAAAAASGPELATDPDGPSWLVTDCDGAAATARFWRALSNTKQP